MNVTHDTFSIRKAFRISIAAALALFSFSTINDAFACATCGCSLSTDAATGYSASTGWRVSADYSFINQDQLRTGTGTISPAQVAAINDAGGNQEVERQTINRYLTFGLSYSPSADWNYRLLAPFIGRSHTTYGAASNPLTPDQLSGASVDSLGDIKFIVGYQGVLPTHNLGFQLGVKLPTGDYGGPSASGTGTVGRNPVSFGPGGNSGGQLLDTSLQAGTGSTDLIIGGYYYQPVSQNFDAFVNGQFQAAVMENLDQVGSDYRPGNLATVSVGLRYEENPRIVPQLQLNITRKSAELGALADTADTAGTVAYLSPGISVNVIKNTQMYAFVQLPLYSHLDGYQLFPHYTATVGISHAF
ncbi:MAG TPA: hypothetical protein VMV70_03695 [Gallionella sp.]|nr:hypothetical protein [Gallionella sp.]